MARADIPAAWPADREVYSGEAAAGALARHRDAQGMYLSCEWRPIVIRDCRRADTSDPYCPEAIAGADPDDEEDEFDVPPWTEYIAFRVVAHDTGDFYIDLTHVDGSAVTSPQRMVSFRPDPDTAAGVEIVTCDLPGDTTTADDPLGGFALYYGSAPVATWSRVRVAWKLDNGAKISSLEFMPLSQRLCRDTIG